MSNASRVLAALTLALACAFMVVPLAGAAPTTVQLRVEGDTSTVFEGPVTTDGRTITKDASGPHRCDGTNGGTGRRPGPTMTSALEDASDGGSFTWSGQWFDSFEDFSIDRIGPDAADNNRMRYWGYALNFRPVEVGGCQQQVQAGDEVLFGYDFFAKQHLLKMTGPARAAVDETVVLTVTDGKNGARIGGASIAGRRTGTDGTARLAFDSPGVKRLKAAREDSLRSNAVEVCVYRPGSGECGTEGPPAPPPAPGPSAAVPPPTVTITSPRGSARRVRLISGRVEAPGGLLGVYLRLRRLENRRCSWFSARSERFSRPAPCAKARFFRLGPSAEFSYLLPERLPRGLYVFEAKALDRGFRPGRSEVRLRVR